MVYEVTLEGIFKKVVVVNAETRELAEDQALEEFRKIVDGNIGYTVDSLITKEGE